MYSDLIPTFRVKNDAVLLAIESSCDETAAAVIKGGREILSSEILSSCKEHIRFGGVVPEIASRAHTSAISIATENAIRKAGVTLSDLDGVCVTYGAGLLGALLVGVSYAKTLAYSLKIPLVPVSHIRGHLAAAYLCDKTLEPPFVSLLASGGHTAVILVDPDYSFRVLGGTMDDAVGESFDKVARVLGLEYPGGPNIERLAREGKNVVPMPKMLKGNGGYSFSYSGLKTAVVNLLHKAQQKGEEVNRADLAASFQKTAVEVLSGNLLRAAEDTGAKTVVLAGGVSANSGLRARMAEECTRRGLRLFVPPLSLCGDNAAMVGAQAFYEYCAGHTAGMELNACPTMPVEAPVW